MAYNLSRKYLLLQERVKAVLTPFVTLGMKLYYYVSKQPLKRILESNILGGKLWIMKIL